MKLQKILLLVDPDQQHSAVLSRAVDLAKRSQASLEIFTCGYTPIIETVIVFEQALWEQTQKAFIEHQTKRLEEWVAPFRTSDVPMSVDVAWEIVLADGMLAKIKQAKPDLVLLDSLPHQGLMPHWLSHHIQWELIKHSSAPLLLVRRDQVLPHAAIVAAIDPLADQTTDNKELVACPVSVSVLTHAKLFAQLYQAQLVPVHAYQTYSAFYALGYEAMQHYASEINQLHRKSALELMEKQQLPGDSVAFLEGNSPAQAVLQYIEKNVAQTLVLGASKKHGLEKLLVGSVAQKVIERAQCDVLVVR